MTLTSHPPLLSVLATRSTPAQAVRAAARLAISSARVRSELPFPPDVGADLIGIRRCVTEAEVYSAGLEGWLDAGLQAPLPAKAEFQARAQIGVIELSQVFRTEPCVQRQEGLAAQLPSGRQLRQRLCPTAAAHTRSDFNQIERYSKVLDQGALQLARQGTGEVGESGLQHIALAQPGG